MPARHFPWIGAALALVFGVPLALAYPSGSPAGRTGAPSVGGIAAEATCTSCHGGHSLNQSGTLEILGSPAQYTPGSSYPITVRLTSSATAGITGRRWGFELTTVRLDNGQGAGGGYQIPASLKTVLGSNGRSYVEQNSSGTLSGAASPVEWTFTWLAPAAGEGSVAFYASGMASNGSGTSGDYIYTAADTAAAGQVPVEPATWGWIKAKGYPR